MLGVALFFYLICGPEPPGAWGQAFRLKDHGAAAAGQGNAVTAMGDNPAGSFYNPAALIRMTGQPVGTQLYSGGNLITLGTRYATPGGQLDRSHNDLLFVPHLFLSTDLGLKDWAFGVSQTVPFGLAVQYADDSPLRYHATSARLQVIDLAVSAAYRLHPRLAIGLGVDRALASMQINNQVDYGARAGSPGDRDLEGTSELSLGGDAYGWHTGLLWQVSEAISLGWRYRSRLDLDMTGRLRLARIPAFISVPSVQEARVLTPLRLPAMLTGGIAIWPVRTASQHLRLEVDLDWVDWRSFQRVSIDLQPPLLGRSQITSPRNFSSVFNLLGGMEYGRKLGRETDLRLRAGYNRIHTPVPEETFDPLIPDADQHLLAWGIGLRQGRLSVDLFNQLIFLQRRGISNNNRGLLESASIDGQYRSFIGVLGISLGLKF